MRIIGSDGQPDMTTINEQTAVGEVLNDVTVGEYDVVMDTGPGFQSKRQQAVEAMMPLLSGNKELFDLAGDLVFRNMDFPGADVIADRLAARNPMAQIDEKSDIPPQVQMQLAQQQQQLQQMQQQLQAAQLEINNRGQIAKLRDDGDTRRKLMDVTARAHNTETMAEINKFTVNSPGKITIDKQGSLWIIQNKKGAKFGKIVNYSQDGKKLPKEIIDVDKPSALAIDNLGRLLVAENGINQQLVIYNINNHVKNILIIW
jgi:hypothetical protein